VEDTAPSQNGMIANFSRPSSNSNIQTSGETFVDMMTSPVMSATEFGKGSETNVLFSTLYSELHRMAKRQLARQWSPNALGVTTLLHEAYLNIANRGESLFPDQARFLGYAGRVMRGLIIDHARNRSAAKRGGEFEITALTLGTEERFADAKELSEIGDALEELASVEPDLATIVDLKFFCGFSFTEIAAMQMVSERTVQRKWEKARIYLHQNIAREPTN
jgi:RNA polymerase sigma factor (TIGR02999 family)